MYAQSCQCYSRMAAHTTMQPWPQLNPPTGWREFSAHIVCRFLGFVRPAVRYPQSKPSNT